MATSNQPPEPDLDSVQVAVRMEPEHQEPALTFESRSMPSNSCHGMADYSPGDPISVVKNVDQTITARPPSAGYEENPSTVAIVSSAEENVVEELQRSLSEPDIKQELFDEIAKLEDRSESPIGIRKSTRLRTRTNAKTFDSGKLGNPVTEVQVSIDPCAIHSRSTAASAELDDDDDEEEEDDDMLDDEDEEFVLDDDEDDEEVRPASGRPPGPGSKKARRQNDDDDDDYFESNDGNGTANDDLDDDDDEFDEYRPLKKRRLPRRRTTKKTNHVAGIKSRTGAKIQMDVLRLQTMLYKVRMHHSVLQRLNQMLTKMNSALVDQLYAWTTGQHKLAIPPRLMLDSVRQKPETENFVSIYDELLQQYMAVVQDKEQLERTIDSQCEPDIVEKAIGKICGGRSKRKVPTIFELIGETTPAAAGAATTSEKPGTANRAEAGADDNGTAKKGTTAGAKRKRSRKRKRDDEEKKNLHCPWPNCTYESKRNWSLNEHINLTHTGLKQFSCKVDGCPATFFGSAELDNHMKKFHAEVASKEFMPCTWPGCNALFKSKLGLRAHVQGHKGENMVACDWPGCNYLAKNKRQHENHTRKHTGDRPFGCDYPGCEAKFRTNDSLRHHKKSHSEYRPFRCDWPGCEANFKTNRGLTIHRALHTGEKLFKCDWPDCDFASERKYHVDLHIYENHTHVKPYPCTWTGCDASFLRNDKLQNHLKIHRQEKPFKCIHPTCDKHFVEKGNMMKHFNNVHKR